MTPRGRSCPIGYRYQPEALAQPARLEADTLYVVGGLYGNLFALRAALKRAGREPGGPAAVVFNGDFHWLDVDADDFRAISQSVLAHHATKGNVEAELASGEDAGCGCAYPDYVGDDVVDRSNQIMTRLRVTAGRFPDLVRRMGDLLDWFGRADVTVLASTHTGLPYAQVIPDGRGQRLVVNNGTAGLPNFMGTGYGVVTRLSTDPVPPADSLYGTTAGAVRCDAVALRFDLGGWKARFLAQWPPGSPGHRAYFTRLTRGTHLRLRQAARAGAQITVGSSGP